MRELTFNITEDKRFLVEPTNVENFNLTFDKPNWVQGRVGEDSLRQVFVNVVTGPNNEPYDLTGINPEFDGLTAKGGPENRNYVVIDNHHSVMIDAQGGRFRFDFPREAFAIAGSYKQAFFSLKREGTGEVVATLEFDMKVMANFVYENVVAFDYVTPFEDLYHQLEQIIETANGDITSKLAEWQTTFQNKYNELTQLGIDTTNALATVQSRLNDLEAQIESDQLVTIPKFEELITAKNYVNQSELTESLQSFSENEINTFYSDDEIKVTTSLANESSTYFAKIKKNDDQGRSIKPTVDLVQNKNAEDPHIYAINSLSTLTINAGLAVPVNRDTGQYQLTTAGNNYDWLHTAVVVNGEAAKSPSEALVNSLPEFMEYIVIKSDGAITSVKAKGTSASELINGGAVSAFAAYWKLVDNGQKTDSSSWMTSEGYTTSDNIGQPSLAFGVFNDGSYGIVACDGRSTTNAGMTMLEWQDYVNSLGFKEAWNLDGGGSTSFNYLGNKMNRTIDHDSDGNLIQRKIGVTLSFIKPEAKVNSLTKSFAQSARVKDNELTVMDRLINSFDGISVKFGGNVSVSTDADVENWLNSLKSSLKYPVLSKGGVVTGRIFLARGDLSLYKANKSTHKSRYFRYEYVQAPYNLSGIEPLSYVRLTSYINENEIYTNTLNNATNQWLGWHTPTVPRTNHNVTSLSENITNLEAYTTTSGLVTVAMRVKKELGNSWTRVATGLPRLKRQAVSFDYAFPSNLGNQIRVTIDPTGDVYARWQFLNDQREDSMSVVVTYPADEFLVD